MTARSTEAFDPSIVAPYTTGEGPRGVVLIHGFASTPPEFRRTADYLGERGWRCSVPLLKGHGTRPQDLAGTTWKDWMCSATTALDDLSQTCADIVVVGQSMGGSMALQLAARDARIKAVAALATPIRFHDWRMHILPALRHFVRWHRPGGDVDLFLPERVHELYSYAIRPTVSLLQLRALLRSTYKLLPAITVPVLLMHGLRDNTVPAYDSREIAHRLIRSQCVETCEFPRSGHALSVDVDRDDVNSRIANFLACYAPLESAAS